MQDQSRIGVAAVTVILLLMIGSGIAAASPSVDVGDGTIDNIGSTTTVDLTLDSAPDGLSGYNLTVSLSDPSIAEILSVSFPTWATMHSNSALPADSVWMKAADLQDSVKSGDTNIQLGTLTIRGDAGGMCEIAVTVTKMDDDSGNPISPATDAGHLEVGGISPTITSHDPSDPVTDTVGATRTFCITTDQIVDVLWQINGTTVQTDSDVTSASYTNTSAAHGIWNVSAVASNTNGVAMQRWLWTVGFSPGDLNFDGSVTSADAAIALEIAAGSRPCDDAMRAIADVSGDGCITSLDALMILQAATGEITL
ncbi:MAG: hypothetical protein C4B59_09530 [Candidatus Methanogaster sp.]|uniref:Uncharacterized protein n=1 Tax=Candidatus Methanogaster sp. TaxID=3386292 RepID=A0AC61L247_9EURY|nr:MAG: hypothetical protein C4B59_09530 [ANME-2 cluster archaeon]